MQSRNPNADTVYHVTPLAEYRDQAQEWIDTNREHAPIDYGAIIPIELIDHARLWQQRLFDANYAGIHWDTAHGGQGLTPEHDAAFAELCQVANVPSRINLVGLTLSAGALRMYGTPEQQHAHLPTMLTGERLWCQLFSEPGAGSDLAGLTTKAELDGDEWIVNGQKVWTSTGTHSEWAILMARTEPDAKKHAGISFFVVDMATPGIDARPLRNMAGTAEFAEVFLTDVRLPADALVGERGQGWTIAMSVLARERGSGTGATAALERRIVTSTERAVAAGLGPVEQDRLVQQWVQGQGYLAMARQSDRDGPQSSLGKLALSEYRFALAEFVNQSSGAAGMLESPQTRVMNASIGSWFAGGTLQVQRNIIGERILGLPKEPKV